MKIDIKMFNKSSFLTSPGFRLDKALIKVLGQVDFVIQSGHLFLILQQFFFVDSVNVFIDMLKFFEFTF